MIEQIRKAIKKAKDDALSKMIYDLGKFFVILFISLLSLNFFPEKSEVSKFFKIQFQLSYFSGLLILALISFIVFFFTSLFFRNQIKKIKADSSIDELTGLLNHKVLPKKLEEDTYWSKTEKKSLSLILMDIDNFKNFNSLYGFQVADEIMEKLGNLLKSDSRVTDSTFRQHMKGDEFIILTRETNLENAVTAANRKRELIGKTGFQIENGETVYLTVCCGVVEFNPNKDSIDSFLKRAHSAMINAKAIDGKNQTKSLI
jgi:diguanylate cyclase (GGDEF)-like protein